MTEKEIWHFLYSRIRNAYAVAGIMGNLEAESNLESERKQGDFSEDRGASYAYTDNIDEGENNTGFIYDGIGYGLAQWTYWSRKRDLLDFAQKENKSVGDCAMQLRFLVKEFQNDYYGWWQQLEKAQSVKEASDIVLYHYEKPANAPYQSDHRAQLGQGFYDKYASDTEEGERTLADILEELGDLYRDLCEKCQSL